MSTAAMNQYFYEQFQRARSQSPSRRERGGSIGSDHDDAPLEASPRARNPAVLGSASPTRALLSVLNRLPHRKPSATDGHADPRATKSS